MTIEQRYNIPSMGTPEFRSYVETPEWMEYRHECALADDAIWEEHQRYMDWLEEGIRWGSIIPFGSSPGPTRDPFLDYTKMYASDFRQRLAPDDGLRMQYQEEIYGLDENELRQIDAKRLSAAHKATMKVLGLA